MTDEMGNMMLDQHGMPQIKMKKVQKKIPYYKPNVYPIVLRRNVTKADKLLGGSDTEILIDQQDTIKKLGERQTIRS